MMLATCERTIGAPLAVVWDLVTTADGLTTWMAESATVELQPGGLITWRHENGEVVAGEVREVVPMRRFVFTFGWETDFFPVQPGSTTVTIELEALAGATRVSIRHAGLTDEMAEQHTIGWTHFVERLGERAEAMQTDSEDDLT